MELIKKKRYVKLYLTLLVFFYMFLGFDCLQAQDIKLDKKGYVDVGFTYKNSYSGGSDPFKYFKFPKEKCFDVKISRNTDRKFLDNFSSFAVRVRLWSLMGDPVLFPSFQFSLNKNGLSGNSHYVNYQDISKYPDLVKRYNSIRPTSVNMVIGLGLNKEDRFDPGAYAFVNITNNDFTIPGSEKSVSVNSPTSKSWGETMILENRDETRYYDDNIEYPKQYLPFEKGNSQEEYYLNILSSAEIVSDKAYVKLSGGTGSVRKNGPDASNFFFDIKWPTEEIDAIYELFKEYENGNQKPPSEVVEELLSNKEVMQYNKTDEWSEPFEDELSDVESFCDGGNRVTGLKNEKRIILNLKTYGGCIIKLNNYNLFYYKDSDIDNFNKVSVFNNRGFKVQVDGQSVFSEVTLKNDILIAEIQLTEKEKVVRTDLGLGLRSGDQETKVYSSKTEARNLILERLQEAEDEFDRRNANRSSSDEKKVYIVQSYDYLIYKKRILFIDPISLNLIRDQEGWFITNF